MNSYKNKPLKVQTGIVIATCMTLLLVIYWIYMRTCVLYQVPATTSKDNVTCCLHGNTKTTK